ncbi:hypothetical protein GGQ64_005354 [Rhizobium azooxidifex]|uniref:Uncharacterized protein n=1 Tax=Mycoplana azooxidifex TaxID=1636188 RepID=A0A7W6DCD4_9HYPH|nr:hypothetical protein [Mycoplana azooxidifex]MBB3980107.1 hypothetical protein [Mycoplana azooxidifex]
MTLLLTNEFPLSDEECQALQIDKREAHVAWLLLFSERGESAMVRAGYCNSITWDMLSLSKSYARAVEIMTKHFLSVVAAPAALAVQYKLLIAKDTAPGVKHQIGKTLMEMAGYGQGEAGDKPVDLDKLDASTLDALIQDLEARKQGMAKTISLTALGGSTIEADTGHSVPVSAPDDSQLADML